MSKSWTLREIAELVGGRLEGDAEREVNTLAPLPHAGAQDLTYLENRKFLGQLSSCEAGGVLVVEDVDVPTGMNVIRVPQPGVAWAKVLAVFHPYQRSFDGVAADAYVDPGASIGEGVGIGPGAYVGPGAKIGARSEIFPCVTVGADVTIGEDCRLYSGVHIYHGCRLGDRVVIHCGSVIGADGYGYVQEKTGDPTQPVVHRKVSQVGNVILEDDVEIGANTTIDRAALQSTVVGRGTKIDNLVMVGHNCRTGSHCLLIAQSGLAGTIEVGHYVTIAGQAGLAGHLKVGDRAIIGAQAGVMRDVDEGQVMIGSPALPGGPGRRAYSQIEHLPEFRRQLKDLSRRIAELEQRLGDSDEQG